MNPLHYRAVVGNLLAVAESYLVDASSVDHVIAQLTPEGRRPAEEALRSLQENPRSGPHTARCDDPHHPWAIGYAGPGVSGTIYYSIDEDWKRVIVSGINRL